MENGWTATKEALPPAGEKVLIMYLMGRDEYECDICGFREKWDAHDDHRGDMWECERCGKHFCTNCFKKACGEEDFRKMLSETDNVLCPECWQNQSQKKEFSINIRETLETQVAVEAENEEAALREVERRWKNGEYILDADNFQGADFWAADHPPVKQIDARKKIDWFELFLSRMRDYSDGEVWGNGDELMCKTEAIADAMCDLLFQLYAAQGEEVVFHTGYLSEKPYGVSYRDFLDVTKKEIGAINRVVMNPPFTRHQDIDHVRHAYDLLDAGGILVAIMCESTFFRTDKKSVEFRDFLDSVYAQAIKLEPGAFRESGTDVVTRIVKIRKPM